MQRAHDPGADAMTEGHGGLTIEAMDIDQLSDLGGSSSEPSTLDEDPEQDAEGISEHAHVIEWLSATAAALEPASEQGDAAEESTKRDTDPHANSTDDQDWTMNLRSYQREMLEQSLRRNVIVTVSSCEYEIEALLTSLQMDTGTGKTRV